MSADGGTFLASGQPRFTVDGQVVAALGSSCFRLEAMEDDMGLSSLEAVFLNLDRPAEGKPVDFLYFDRQIIDFGKKIEVAFDVSGTPVTVFQGLVTAIGGEFPEAREPELIVHAEDALAQLRMRRRTRVFKNSSDSDILQQVAGDAGLNPSIQIDGPSHVQHLQVNQSDLDLLRERTGALDGLMTLNDQAFQVQKRSAAADTPIRMSNYNELLRFTVLADLAHQRTKVRVHGWDVAAKQPIHEQADNDDARAVAGSGGRTGPEVLVDLWPQAAEDLHGEAPATTDEARALAKAIMQQRARNFVRGRGTANGNPALRVGARVELVDIGAFFSGVYQLTAVRHAFDMSYGYRTHFEASRAELGNPT
jgi:phage protein D